MSFPVPNSTTSFWRTDLDDLDSHRSTECLPAEADILIIGAGYAGASIAYHLLEATKQSLQHPSIVILEARAACSGATGRNGGHLKPDPYYRAASVLKAHGKEAAEEVAAFEARQVHEIKELVEKEKIECDFMVTRATDVCLYEEARTNLKAGLESLKNSNISTAADVFYSDQETAEGVSGVKGAKGCFTYTAAHLWPYKLVLHLLKKAVSAGVNLQTCTPVQSIAYDTSVSGPCIVKTARGSIRVSKIIYACNAYTSALLPEFKKAIVPVRGICCRIIPAEGRRLPLLSNSYILRIAPGEYDYLIPRSDGSIIVGGGRGDYYKQLGQWYDNADDSSLIEPAKNHFDGYMQKHFHGWENSGARIDRVWTGIMGYSSDNMPHVGQIPGRQNQYICAGFSGHGMPQIFLSAKALTRIVLQGCNVENLDIPRLYQTSQARLDSERDVNLEAWAATNGVKVQSRL